MPRGKELLYRGECRYYGDVQESQESKAALMSSFIARSGCFWDLESCYIIWAAVIPSRTWQPLRAPSWPHLNSGRHGRNGTLSSFPKSLQTVDVRQMGRSCDGWIGRVTLGKKVILPSFHSLGMASSPARSLVNHVGRRSCVSKARTCLRTS